MGKNENYGKVISFLADCPQEGSRRENKLAYAYCQPGVSRSWGVDGVQSRRPITMRVSLDFFRALVKCRAIHASVFEGLVASGGWQARRARVTRGSFLPARGVVKENDRRSFNELLLFVSHELV